METAKHTTGNDIIQHALVGDPTNPTPRLKAIFLVNELAERWQVHPESVRILIRKGELKPLRAFRPYRITYDEVRRFECLTEETEVREAYLANRRRRT